MYPVRPRASFRTPLLRVRARVELVLQATICVGGGDGMELLEAAGRVVIDVMVVREVIKVVLNVGREDTEEDGTEALEALGEMADDVDFGA